MADARPIVMLMPVTLNNDPDNTTADSASGSLRWPTKVVEMKVSIMEAIDCSAMGTASRSSLEQNSSQQAPGQQQSSACCERMDQLTLVNEARLAAAA